MMMLRLAVSALVIFPVVATGQEPVTKPLPTRTVTTRPAPPANVTASITGPGQVTISWDAVPGASAYDIGFHVPPDGWRRLTRVTGGATSYVDGGRDLTKPHMYQVVAIVGDLASLPARSDTVMQTAAAPSDPPAADTVPPSVPNVADAYCTTLPPDARICRSSTYNWTGRHSGVYTLTASCPTGFRVVSGGHDGHFEGATVIASGPVYPEGWQIRINGIPTDRPTQPSFIRALAHCRPT